MTIEEKRTFLRNFNTIDETLKLTESQIENQVYAQITFSLSTFKRLRKAYKEMNESDVVGEGGVQDNTIQDLCDLYNEAIAPQMGLQLIDKRSILSTLIDTSIPASVPAFWGSYFGIYKHTYGSAFRGAYIHILEGNDASAEPDVILINGFPREIFDEEVERELDQIRTAVDFENFRKKHIERCMEFEKIAEKIKLCKENGDEIPSKYVEQGKRLYKACQLSQYETRRLYYHSGKAMISNNLLKISVKGYPSANIWTKDIFVDIGPFVVHYNRNRNLNVSYVTGIGLMVSSSTNDPMGAMPKCKKIAFARTEPYRRAHIDNDKLEKLLSFGGDSNSMIVLGSRDDSVQWTNMVRGIDDNKRNDMVDYFKSILE